MPLERTSNSRTPRRIWRCAARGTSRPSPGPAAARSVLPTSLRPSAFRFPLRFISRNCPRTAASWRWRLRMELPLFDGNLERTGYLNDAFESCLFASPGLFRTCAPFGKATKVVEVRDAKTKTRIAHRKVANPFAESIFILYRHPSQSSAVILGWSRAGSPTRVLGHAERRYDPGEAFRRPPFRDAACFQPRRREFLVTDGERVARYSYPDGPLLGEMDQLAGDPVGYSEGMYLDQRRVLLTSAEGRLFVVNAEVMEVVDDVSILGFEERPMSPFQGLLGLSGNKFLSVHGDPGAEMGDNWVHLAAWSLPPA